MGFQINLMGFIGCKLKFEFFKWVSIQTFGANLKVKSLYWNRLKSLIWDHPFIYKDYFVTHEILRGLIWDAP